MRHDDEMVYHCGAEAAGIIVTGVLFLLVGFAGWVIGGFIW